MKYVLDALVVLIPLVAIFIGAQRGFAKMLVRLAGTVLALVVAVSLSSTLAEGVFDSFIADGLQEKIVSQVPELSASSVTEGVESALENLPGFLTTFMEQQGLDPTKLAAEITVASDSGNIAQTVSKTIVTQVIRPMAVPLLTVLCFLILIILLLVVVRLLALLVDRFFRLPGLKTLNGVLGAVVGAAEGVLLMLLTVTVLQLIAYSSASDALISQSVLDQSVLFRWVAEINPLTACVGDVTVGIGGFLKG